jgi:NAD(P)-dependent dehydrogenase (short-subunit alcohol dehydrogenase family)
VSYSEANELTYHARLVAWGEFAQSIGPIHAVESVPLISASGNPNADLLVADLSSQAEVRHLAEEVKSRYPHLHVLINNAGVAPSKRQVTVDGLEMVFAVNYLAPFLLTNLMLDLLKAIAPARRHGADGQLSPSRSGGDRRAVEGP